MIRLFHSSSIIYTMSFLSGFFWTHTQKYTSIIWNNNSLSQSFTKRDDRYYLATFEDEEKMKWANMLLPESDSWLIHSIIFRVMFCRKNKI